MINICVAKSRWQLYRQLLIYAIIGVLTNLIIYGLYIFITNIFGWPKLTMTILYISGASIGFLANRRFTFCRTNRIGVAGVRYFLAQISGYFLNLFIFLIFVDWFDFSHQVIQAMAIFVVGIFLFVVMRVYVFAE